MLRIGGRQYGGQRMGGRGGIKSGNGNNLMTRLRMLNK